MPKTYIINTNKSNCPTDESDMLHNKKCAAYFSPWKYYIDEIEANDIIFLYSSGRGIIARGIATGIPETKDYRGEIDEEHYMELDRFQILSTPLEASEITKIVQHRLQYNQTVISLAHKFGIQVWQFITKNCI
ncbi:hypothetical protein CACET_c27060 [Clostridium aceticum]|uniref:Uncharacterized protein n=2 Tax=Clostridium aceticum TaxID=84022 RepID=A0A0D8I953_9CLOT|nr:hypothetical protein [Clostridium aceticum]AKL96151.1 hypothetical protein CACET_c27060 [Clostridium aceticum]KJF26574.1 hypothetical protein TZ02_11905 [Clostridium aceticum]